MARKYKAHVGRSYLRNETVVAYDEGDEIVLVAETSGGARTRRQILGDDGRRRWITIPERRMSAEQYESLREIWGDGCASSGDVRITKRALEWMGAEFTE